LKNVKEEYQWLRRKNNYNEEEENEVALDEDNLVVSTWINDLGKTQNEFDVSNFFCFNIPPNRTKYCFIIMKQFCFQKVIVLSILDTLRQVYLSISAMAIISRDC